ncbi:MAG: hypothetical protein EOM03_09560, partial [Clostridia bacterium]|nr:hypothetical protein [Clostridia bacterium]
CFFFAANKILQELILFSYVSKGSRLHKRLYTLCGFHVEPSSSLPSVPILLESPLALLCKVRKSEHLGSHTLFLADIVGLEVAEAICSNDGKIDLGKAGLLAYAHGHYYELGPVLGFFGYSVAKAKIRKQRL